MADGAALVRVPRPDAPQRITLQRTARAVAASPDGRWLALTAVDGGAIGIFDVARGRERWTVVTNDPVIAAGSTRDAEQRAGDLPILARIPRARRGFKLFVRYRFGRGEAIPSTPVGVTER